MKEYKRQCPKCGEELHYKYRQSYWKACKTNNWCGSCRKLEVNSRPEYQNKLKIINDSFKEKFKGKNNPFFGKKHTNRSISLIKANTSVKYGDKNPCYKKSVYYWWEKKYGKEAADTKLLNFKKILSNKMSGEKNPMYGKPSPPGAGNGWSGWYKGWYFRSI